MGKTAFSFGAPVVFRSYYTTEKSFWQQDLPKAFEFFSSCAGGTVPHSRFYSARNRASTVASSIQAPASADRMYQRRGFPRLAECAVTNPTISGAMGRRKPFRTLNTQNAETS